MKLSEVQYEIAASKHVGAIEALIGKEYAKQGYIKEAASTVGTFSSYLRLPTTTTFIALHQEELLGTVSIFKDSEHGLPMDVIYKEEVDALREEGKLVAEVGQLAVDVEALGQGKPIPMAARLPILMTLFQSVRQYSLQESIDCLCITVNPKHERLYSKLSFQPLGELKMYPSVNNAPALAKVLHLPNG